MFYEVLKSQGLDCEKGRFSKNRKLFIVKYCEERFPELKDYKSVFKTDDPNAIMEYLVLNQRAWDIDCPPKPSLWTRLKRWASQRDRGKS